MDFQWGNSEMFVPSTKTFAHYGRRLHAKRVQEEVRRLQSTVYPFLSKEQLQHKARINLQKKTITKRSENIYEFKDEKVDEFKDDDFVYPKRRQVLSKMKKKKKKASGVKYYLSNKMDWDIEDSSLSGSSPSETSDFMDLEPVITTKTRKSTRNNRFTPLTVQKSGTKVNNVNKEKIKREMGEMPVKKANVIEVIDLTGESDDEYEKPIVINQNWKDVKIKTEKNEEIYGNNLCRRRLFTESDEENEDHQVGTSDEETEISKKRNLKQEQFLNAKNVLEAQVQPSINNLKDIEGNSFFRGGLLCHLFK